MFPIFISMIENDDERSFVERIYEENKDIMYIAAYKILNQEQEAEDIVSICFVKITNDIKYFMEKSCHELPGILVKIANNAAIDRYRQIKNIPTVPLLENDSDGGDNFSDMVGDFVVNKDLRDRLYTALNTLDQDYMTVIKLKLLHDCPYSKIAELMGISESNVRKRYSRAVNMLKKQLKRGEENDK